MQARIYQPAKNAMQSGRAGTGQWVLEYETVTPRRPEELMGWTSAGDTLNQIILHFTTLEEATDFAARKGLEVDIEPAHKREVTPRNYADNFKAPVTGDAAK